MSALVSESGAPPLSLAEARDWLRLGPGESDGHVAGLVRAAASLCEAWTGQMLVVREVTEERDAAAGWMRLARHPVVGIDAVLRLRDRAEPVLGPAEPVLVPADGWAVQMHGDGAAAVRLSGAAAGDRAQVRYRAGMAEHPSGVPEALRQGLLRLVQHWHFSGQEDERVPAIVTALWAPWRRVTLGVRP